MALNLRVLLAWSAISALATAQSPAPLKLSVPKDHPRIGISSAELEKVRANIANEPWVTLWKTVVAKSEGTRRGALTAKDAFGGARGQGARFTVTEALECVALHALVGKDAGAAKALSDFFEAWDPASLEKDIGDTDFMSSGEFFEGLAVVLDWTWDLLSDKGRAALRAIVERRAKHNYDGFIGKKSWEATTDANNHSMASMGALGLAAVALWHENPDAPKWAGLVKAKMDSYLASSFDPDGACYEGTMYGPFGLFRILPFSDCCLRYGAGDALQTLLPKVLVQLTNELVPGRERMLPINDTDGNYRSWGGLLFLYDAARHESPISRWMWADVLGRSAGNGGHTWAFAVLWEDGKTDGRPPEKKVAVTRGRGTFTVRTGWEKDDFLAAFECGKRVPGCHGQSDVGHFLVYAKGRCLAADTGYSNVAQEGTPHQSVGHNLVLVDGKGQVITGGGGVTEGKLVQWEERKSLVWAQADLANAYAQKAYNPMAVAARCFLVLTGPDPYVVVADAFVKDAKDHEYTWLLHGNADSKFDLAGDRATHVAGSAALDVVPCLLDAAPPAFETKRFPSNNFGEHDVLRATMKGKRWLGPTVLAPRGSSDEPVAVKREVKSGKLVVTVTRGGAKDEFTLTAAPNGGIAAIRVVRTADGKPAAEELKLK
ncbi:MAG: heparinase II/III family protein [Planctomycetia bacterium]|nr:heparinase II/III family protein [Planctomycetia bacterium]